MLPRCFFKIRICHTFYVLIIIIFVFEHPAILCAEGGLIVLNVAKNFCKDTSFLMIISKITPDETLVAAKRRKAIAPGEALLPAGTTLLQRVPFKLSPVHVLRTKAGRYVAFSTDIVSLRETVARRAFISVEPYIIHPTIARRASTKNDNWKCTLVKRQASKTI
jgi:hypothetical protein